MSYLEDGPLPPSPYQPLRILYEDIVDPGVPLRDMPFGTVVARAVNGWHRVARAGNGWHLYLVASPMDGTGRKVLISLPSGMLKDVPQDLLVVPVDAQLNIRKSMIR
jgi:hypothetical protein